MQTAEIRNTLQECEFFKGLTTEQLDGLAAICRVCRFGPAEIIYRQGEAGSEIFVIAEGQVALERAIRLGSRMGTVPVVVLGKGKIIGGWSTLLNEPHTLMLSAICRRPCVLLALRGSELRQRMTSDIRLGFQIMEKLCFVLRERVQLTLGALNNL